MIISISPMAQVDLKEIKKYIESELENSEAAINTITKITKSIHRLSEFPDSGALLSSKASIQIDCRFLIVGSYFVFYRHERDHIYVLRVLYGRRDYMKILFGDSHNNS
ncbi:type II toxin-antitoxin system RelE/ParE family toxin [Sporolactobacillus sp. STSJ-5]|uniref:type II toxin-antitoxin system RelE/ParE family toxin n=1 Tax=Sporolactobacillus sp. STSJ-5 TaxID=2965076 RepID=UPI0021041297|nr:type II toxin-antitoxin system RelE/ParE family toxin [Sporolactobacillus sp. STSJ-5]MCQ2010963.1 type II toxin-antitoxin system RelE/ParE family toxin [Sporolactobacillus sp. STSJ-5]